MTKTELSEIRDLMLDLCVVNETCLTLVSDLNYDYVQKIILSEYDKKYINKKRRINK